MPVAVVEAGANLTVSLRLRRKRIAQPFRAPGGARAGTPAKQRKHLTRAQYRQQYGAEAADIAKVEAFAKSHGLRVAVSDAGRRTIALAGTAAQMNAAFAVELQTFHTGKMSYISHAGPARVPIELAGIIESIHGLDTRPLAQPMMRSAAANQATSPLLPAQVASLYHFPTNSAAGQTIGILEFGGGYRIADVQQYFQTIANLPVPSVSFVGIDGATNSPGADADTEVILDIAVAGSVAPGAKIVVYFAPNTDQGWMDAVTTAISDTANDPCALSISWAGGESGWDNISAMSKAFAEAQLVGIPIFVSSGDGGSGSPPEVLYPASDPGVTGCGGTTISDVSGASFTQTTWGGSGGGVSNTFALPAWQQGLQVTLASGQTTPLTKRGVPDIAGNADPASGYQLVLNGQSIGVWGGTSAVAPLYAGLAALLRAALAAPVGFLNGDIYSSEGPVLDDDVTVGSNGAYNASAGWDACTGWGSTWGAALLNVLAPVPAGIWHHNDLTNAASAPAAAGKPDGYLFVAQGTQHVNYRGTDGHIHELWWDASGWHHNDLTNAAGAPAAAGDPTGYMFDAQATQHVDYRGTDGHIHELWWDASGWHHNDLTNAAGAPAAAGNPVGYVFAAQGTQHVVYQGTDGHIHELWWDASGWHHNDLTNAAGAPATAGDPTGYVFDAQGTQHVDYRGTDGHMHELWWDASGWHHNDLTNAAGAPAPAGNPTGYVFDAQGTQHVDYIGTDGHIHELWWDASGWHHNDLTNAAGAPAAAGNPVGYMFDAQGTQHVDYRGTDGHMHELWWDASGWHHNDLTIATAAPPAAGNPAGYMFVAQGTQHVDYLGADNDIHELWWG